MKPIRFDGITIALAVSGFLQWLGASAVLPLLPLYLHQHGASSAAIGVVAAAFYVGGVLAEYGSGRLTDRIGRRPILIAGIAIYALASFGFLLPVSVPLAITLRLLQGAGAGASAVAALAMASHEVPSERRGTAFAVIFGAQVGGAAFGPLLAAVAGLDHMAALFIASGVTAAAAALPVIARAPHDVFPDDDIAASKAPLGPAIRGVLLAGIASGVLTGAYEACWSLLLNYRGASQAQVALSWTLFAVPFVAVSIPAGRLADRLDRRKLVVISLLCSVVFASTYPFIPRVAVAISLAAFEALGVSLAYPSLQSLLSQYAPAGTVGHVQGMFAASQTLATATAAAIGGALFAVAPWAPFVASASVTLVIACTLPWVWRGVEGRVSAGVPAPAHDAGRMGGMTTPIA